MQRKILFTWLFFCVLVLLGPLRDIHNGEAHILFAMLMGLLTFPAGYILMAGISFLGFLLDRHLGVSLPSNEIMLGPLWLGLVVVGYFQWFVVVPRLWRKWCGGNAT